MFDSGHSDSQEKHAMITEHTVDEARHNQQRPKDKIQHDRLDAQLQCV